MNNNYYIKCYNSINDAFLGYYKKQIQVKTSLNSYITTVSVSENIQNAKKFFDKEYLNNFIKILYERTNNKYKFEIIKQ